MDSKGKSATQIVAQRFAQVIHGKARFALGQLLECENFLNDYGWEFNPPFKKEQPAQNQTLIEFSGLLNNDKSGAFIANPESFQDMYVVVKRDNKNKIIAGTAFYMLHIDTTRVCYIEAIAVRDDYKHMGIGSQMISLLKECLRSFRGQGKDIEYLYLFAEVSRVAKPHDFFKKKGAKAGFPADFASWKNLDLDQMYILVEPFSAKDSQNLVRDPLLLINEKKVSIDSSSAIIVGSKGKSKTTEKTSKKAMTAIEETKAPLTPVTAKPKPSKAINQKGRQLKDAQRINKSEAESSVSRMTNKTASGAINKHCMHEKCQGKVVVGNNWGVHLKKVHEGATFTCNKDFFYCSGDDCHFCQDSAQKTNRHGEHSKKQCSQCGELKRQDLFSKETKEICNVCTKANLRDSKIGSAEKQQQQPKLTQENLDLLEDQHMQDEYEDQEQEQDQYDYDRQLQPRTN